MDLGRSDKWESLVVKGGGGTAGCCTGRRFGWGNLKGTAALWYKWQGSLRFEKTLHIVIGSKLGDGFEREINPSASYFD